MRIRPWRGWILGVGSLLAACRTGRNYLDPTAPRYARSLEPTASPRGDTLRIVSFNIEFSREIQRASQVLASDHRLRGADVVLLQEMTDSATRTIADLLGMSYVYYPAIYSKRARRDVGNAVLTRWRIVEDAKLILPERSRYAGTHRTATAATIRVGHRAVRVYSTHLGTVADISAKRRARQLAFILADAARFPAVIVGGDMNSKRVGAVATTMGFAWPTQSIPKSTKYGQLDHVFVKGFVPTEPGAGTATTARGISDHRPVWVTAVFSTSDGRN